MLRGVQVWASAFSPTALHLKADLAVTGIKFKDGPRAAWLRSDRASEGASFFRTGGHAFNIGSCVCSSRGGWCQNQKYRCE